MNSGVYMVRHRESGKTYVGRSVDIANRWGLHRRHTEQGRDRSPFHRALRKYGYDAFDWVVLVGAPAKLQPELEHAFIETYNAMVPAGYNVGGVHGGRPSRALMALMGDVERAAVQTDMQNNAKNMHRAMRARRTDPTYDAQYRRNMSSAAKARWARRKERLAIDPVFAAEVKAQGAARAAKAQETIKRRRAEDREFDKHMRAVLSDAAKKARAHDPRTIQATARREGEGR